MIEQVSFSGLICFDSQLVFNPTTSFTIHRMDIQNLHLISAMINVYNVQFTSRQGDDIFNGFKSQLIYFTFRFTRLHALSGFMQPLYFPVDPAQLHLDAFTFNNLLIQRFVDLF